MLIKVNEKLVGPERTSAFKATIRIRIIIDKCQMINDYSVLISISNNKTYIQYTQIK